MTLGADEILERTRKLAPQVAARADEIAKLRRLPADLVAELKAAGVFRMPMPAAWGGPEVSPRVRSALARAEGQLGAARAYTYETMDRVWDSLQRGEPLSHELRLHVSMSRLQAFDAARDVAQQMIDTAGSSSIYSRSPLDRLMRDAITLRTHVAVQERLMDEVAALALGEEPRVPFL